jgi:sugar-specific transcriptional regulator TrmB
MNKVIEPQENLYRAVKPYAIYKKEGEEFLRHFLNAQKAFPQIERVKELRRRLLLIS